MTGVQPPSAAHGRARKLRLLGGACAAVGLGALIWLVLLMYGRTPADEALLIGIGIPLLMLIAWAGLALFMRGVAWMFARSR